MIPQKKIERKFLSRGYDSIIAVDEVGMGSLAGPVVVCAVKFGKSFFGENHKNLNRLKDSKLLNHRQRERYAKELSGIKGISYKIRYAYPKTIDRLNIYRAARMAMKRAVLNFQRRGPVAPHPASPQITSGLAGVPSRATPIAKIIVLVDGPHKIPRLSMEQMTIVKGDRKVFSIACASVLAKVYRDRMMKRYAKRYPDYGFEIHKGYGTKNHYLQLSILGPSDIHRRSFNLKY
jgi:ribonuclease HII